VLTIRLAKISCAAAIAFYVTLVAFGNLSDYWTNFAFVKEVLDITLGFLLFEGGFVAVGGEWFGMWQARDIDAVPSAFRILMTMLGVLIFVSLKDEDLV
jgi:predicted small integral membrane protein